jgi:predicted HTH transcriptional regulator
LKERFSPDELSRMYQWHALPDNWELMEYRAFLEKRRDLIAQIIAKGYQTLISGPEEEKKPQEFDLSQVITNGESEALEFKSTLRTNLHTGNKDPRMELSALKTIAGFLNTSGGTLIIGLADDRTPVGVEADGFPNEDKMSLHLVNIVKSRMGPQAMISIHLNFDDVENSRVTVVKCRKAVLPVFVKDGEIERFYIRMGPSTDELSASQTQEYIKHRFKG